VISYWEKQSLLQIDVAIIGSGITGLSAAISLKEKLPHLSVAIFERGVLPSGASTRNAGFACIGSVGEIVSDLKLLSTKEALQLIEMRFKGLQLLRQRLGDAKIQYRENGSFELLHTNELYLANEIEVLNKLLHSITNQTTFSIASTRLIEQFGFNQSCFAGIIQNHCEGELHTGEMMKHLHLLAIEKGVQLYTGCEVKHIEDTGVCTNINVARNIADATVSFTAKRAIVATNAFTSSLFPTEEATPGRGIVLITKPIKTLPFKGIFHFNEGYYYFREIDNRVLLGGGRNEDFIEETTTSFNINEHIYNLLLQKLSTHILPNQPFEIDMQWSGIMAFGATKKPNLKWLSTNTFGAFKMGGMGVAIGSLAGEIAAENIATSLQ